MAIARKLRSLFRSPSILSRILGNSPRRSSSRDGQHILLAAPGGGNVGDEALVEAFVAGIDRSVTVVVRSSSAYPGLVNHPRVTLLELPDLLHGPVWSSLRDAMRLRRLWRGAASFSVIGADVMDGAYDWRASATRSVLARRAALDGLDARVVGFSWNSSPHPQAAEAMRRAGSAGVRILARDASSRERLKTLVPGVVLTADIVFTDERREPLSEELAVFISAGHPYAVVNASGLVARSSDQTDGYIQGLRSLIEAGIRVVLLPHVIRSSGDDYTACRRVWEALGAEERAAVLLVDRLLRPAQVRQLAASARLVITGRMHLGVIALSQGVPAIIVATQGKVEGLLTLFEATELVVPPAGISSGAIVTAIHEVLRDEEVWRRKIGHHAPDVKELAMQNLVGLR